MVCQDEITRLLGIKTSVVNRIRKEISIYEKEAEQQLETINKMKALLDNTKDPEVEARLRKQYQVYDETVRMIPDCKESLEAASKDLEKFIALNNLNAVKSE